MSEPIEAVCPSCGPALHELLKGSARGRTVQCTECHAVHREQAPRERSVTLRAILSQGEDSTTGRVEVATTDEVEIGSEFDFGDGRFLVTGLETHDGRRRERALAHQIKTLYAKSFDEVLLKFTLNEGPSTRSLSAPFPPEARIHVGDHMEIQGIPIIVKSMKSDQNRAIRKGYLLARSIRRVFCDPEAPKLRNKA